MPVQSINYIHASAADPMYWRLEDFYRHLLGLVPGHGPEVSSPGAWPSADGKPIVHLIRLDSAAASCSASALHGAGLDHVAMRSRGLAKATGHLTLQHRPHGRKIAVSR
jgi:hypothetical protein